MYRLNLLGVSVQNVYMYDERMIEVCKNVCKTKWIPVCTGVVFIDEVLNMKIKILN